MKDPLSAMERLLFMKAVEQLVHTEFGAKKDDLQAAIAGSRGGDGNE